MKVSWTGHRPEYFQDPVAVAHEVEAIAASLRARYGSALAFHCGGQRGVDTWAAMAAERLRLPLYLYLPLPIVRFTADWSTADVSALERSQGYATEQIVVDPDGSLAAAAYSRRNWLLAERGDVLHAVWSGMGGGGTGETIQFARQLGRPVYEHRFAASGRIPRPGERGL